VPVGQHGQTHREVVAMCAGFARDQADLERLVFFGDESRRADLDEAFLDEDLEVLRVR
jgi:hypothetical protein